jgi:hypothetical protein
MLAHQLAPSSKVFDLQVFFPIENPIMEKATDDGAVGRIVNNSSLPGGNKGVYMSCWPTQGAVCNMDRICRVDGVALQQQYESSSKGRHLV